MRLRESANEETKNMQIASQFLSSKAMKLIEEMSLCFCVNWEIRKFGENSLLYKANFGVGSLDDFRLIVCAS